MTSITPDKPDTLLRIADVLKLVGFSRSKLWEDVSAGRFPAPIATGERSRRWLASEIAKWQAERIAERDGPPPMPEYRGPGRPRRHPAQAAA